VLIELADDFRDLLLELADAGAQFVLVGGHAVRCSRNKRADGRPQDIADGEAIAPTESHDKP
jgi:hypothetical protein